VHIHAVLSVETFETFYEWEEILPRNATLVTHERTEKNKDQKEFCMHMNNANSVTHGGPTLEIENWENRSLGKRKTARKRRMIS
jgi:hypothetical protein